jgi:hypothetical protein
MVYELKEVKENGPGVNGEQREQRPRTYRWPGMA